MKTKCEKLQDHKMVPHELNSICTECGLNNWEIVNKELDRIEERVSKLEESVHEYLKGMDYDPE